MPGSALILTRGEAAELLGISPSTFDNWVRKGVIPKPLEGTKRWSRAAIERAVSGEPVSVAEAYDPEAIYEELKRRHWKEPLQQKADPGSETRRSANAPNCASHCHLCAKAG